MSFENPLLSKLFSSVLESKPVKFDKQMMGESQVYDAIDQLPIPLSKRQYEAVARTWFNEVSYIQGPPGTGKSHTIAAIMASAFILGRSVLLVSHKKPAIDVVYDKLTKDLSNKKSLLGKGAVIYASENVNVRKEVRENLMFWLSKSGVTKSSRAATSRSRATQLRIKSEVLQIHKEVRNIEESITKTLNAEKEYFELQEKFSKNRNIFYKDYTINSSKTIEFPVGNDVEKVLKLLNDFVLLLEEYFENPNQRISNLQLLKIKRFYSVCVHSFKADSKKLSFSLTSLRYLNDHLDLVRDYQLARLTEKKISPDYLDSLRKKLNNLKDALHIKQQELLKAEVKSHILDNLTYSEEHLEKFRTMIHYTNSKIIAERMDAIEYKELIRTFPLWVGQMRNLGEFLPFEPNLFDLVIVDEASQVNIAEIIPAFYRGSRICVVGDDKQLGLNAAGVNFGFGIQFEEIIWSKYFSREGISYVEAEQKSLLVRKHSILDFICALGNGILQKTTLDEHFRSYPQLASFTSDQFYSEDGGLKLMKEVPKNLGLNCFYALEVGGTRSEDVKIVETEVDELFIWLNKYIRDYIFTKDSSLMEHGFSMQNIPSIGIISFLRDQRDYIQELIVEKFNSYEIETFNLFVGTPEEFQGNERDVVFITLGLSGGETRINQWEEIKRFNVATSRSKSLTYFIYGGVPKNAKLVKKYLSHFGKSWNSSSDNNINTDTKPTVTKYQWDWNRSLHRDLCESDFEHKVADYLEEFVELNGGAANYKLFNQVKASRAIGVSSCGQKRLDFVLLNVQTGKCVAIEVDGRDHYSEDGRSYTESHMERVDILQRAGWNILHIPYYKWWKNGWLCDRHDIDFKNNIKNLYESILQLIGPVINS